MRDIYYSMGYAKNFDMYLADSKFELPRMKKGGKAKQTPSMGVSAFGEATVEDIGMGPERNSRTVTFELSQRSEETASPPPLISSDNASK